VLEEYDELDEVTLAEVELEIFDDEVELDVLLDEELVSELEVVDEVELEVLDDEELVDVLILDVVVVVDDFDVVVVVVVVVVEVFEAELEVEVVDGHRVTEAAVVLGANGLRTDLMKV